MAAQFSPRFQSVEEFQARLTQDAAQMAEMQRLIQLKEVEIQLMKDKYQAQIQTNLHLQALKKQVAQDQKDNQYCLQIIAEKTGNYERRHCEQSYEMPGAARNLQIFCQATGRGCLSRQHLKVFADFIEAGECAEDFNYGTINRMKDEHRIQYMCVVVWFKHNQDSLIKSLVCVM